MTRRRWLMAQTFGLLATILIGAVLLNIGPTRMTLGDASSLHDAIIWQTRFPRLLLALLVGMALSSTGAVYQTLLRNPLADPFILGISGGAALGSAIGIAYGFPFLLVIALSFAIGLLTMFGIVALAGARGAFASDRLLLAGVVTNAFAFALMLAIHTLLPPDRAQHLLFLLMGSLSSPTAAMLGLLAGIVLSGLALLMRYSRTLDALALGEETAVSIGIDFPHTQRALFIISSCMVGAVVAMSGLIGFVGLFVPHAVRAVVGTGHKAVLPLSALAGGAFLMIADTIARSLFRVGTFQTELPIGVITALIGAPCFIALLRRSRA